MAFAPTAVAALLVSIGGPLSNTVGSSGAARRIRQTAVAENDITTARDRSAEAGAAIPKPAAAPRLFSTSEPYGMDAGLDEDLHRPASPKPAKQARPGSADWRRRAKPSGRQPSPRATRRVLGSSMLTAGSRRGSVQAAAMHRQMPVPGQPHITFHAVGALYARLQARVCPAEPPTHHGEQPRDPASTSSAHMSNYAAGLARPLNRKARRCRRGTPVCVQYHRDAGR